MITTSARPTGYQTFKIDYGQELEDVIAKLETAIADMPVLAQRYDPRWLAIKLLEDDAHVIAKIENVEGVVKLHDDAKIYAAQLQSHSDEDLDTILASLRYGWIHSLVQDIVGRKTEQEASLSDRIDKVVTHRLLGIPIFLALMWAVFKITTDVAAPFLDWVDGVINGPIANWIVAILGLIGLTGTWVESLFLDGIVAGVGGVLVFVPVLMSLYLALAILEDSGYMARAAFVMDRPMQAIGLHGKSFLPMIVGFGCTVPAVYATRTLENERDRILTGLLVPFMSCGARLPVYVLFASIFFPDHVGRVVFILYLTGIVVAMLVGLLLKSTLLKGDDDQAFLLELPPYRMPTARNVWKNTWGRTSSFVRKAFTIIMATSIIVWILMAIPVTGEGGNAFADTAVDNSAFATVSGILTPVFEPAGFGDWRASGSIITGFIAKEVVVGTMAQVYGVEEGEAEEAAEPTTFLQDLGGIGTSFLQATWDTIKSIPLIIGINLFEGEEEEEPTDLMVAARSAFESSSGGHGALAAIAFLVFVLLYTPCMVAVAAQRQEFGTRWMLFAIVGQFVVAWLAALLIFQGGLLLGLG
jgi:ferrous iron transport protein B